MMNRPLFLSACACALFSLGSSLFGAWGKGDVLPNLNGFGLEGASPSLKGKVVYLDFWASWCGPCKASFPVLDRWQRQFGARGFTVVGVSVDEKAEDMQKFLQKAGISFPVVRDAKHQLVAAADVSNMPTSFLIDRKGVIREVHNGFREKDAEGLAAMIAALLAEK